MDQELRHGALETINASARVVAHKLEHALQVQVGPLKLSQAFSSVLGLHQLMGARHNALIGRSKHGRAVQVVSIFFLLLREVETLRQVSVFLVLLSRRLALEVAEELSHQTTRETIGT